MKIRFTLFILFLSTAISFAQTSKDYAVLLTSTIQRSPDRITLHWPLYPGATGYNVFRKYKDAISWGSVRATLPGTATSFTDTAVTSGISYEYRVSRAATVNGEGYINSGINIAATEGRGIMVLIIDSSMETPLSAEIARLTKDLEMDGWQINSSIVSRSAAASDVKATIMALYSIDPSLVNTVLLIGHVPVPYSGGFDPYPPDGHLDHVSAWPADVYYADMDGSWPDATVNNTSGGDPRNRNIPGDGKFDPAFLPSDAELQVGRIDFANMPSFSSSETELLRKYLDKDHNYRSAITHFRNRGIIDDNFGGFGGEAFAASAWKSFSPILGDTAIDELDLFTTAHSNNYLWAYGCGGGSYGSCAGVGTTTDFAADSLQTVFSAMFGSYFGDWDATDDLLRASLASGSTLTTCWSGRPHWYFHHMAMGEPIGYSTRLTQNNGSLYFTNSSPRGIHIALLGDPSLRMYVYSGASALVANAWHNNVQLSWTASSEPVLGYHVYKRDDLGVFQRISDSIIIGTQFWDSCVSSKGMKDYMVRAIRLEQTPSGTFYNMSKGISDTALVDSLVRPNAGFTYSNLGYGNYSFSTTQSNPGNVYWDFGDGESADTLNPIHHFAVGATYTVRLIARNACYTVFNNQSVHINTGIQEAGENVSIALFPNPADEQTTMRWTSNAGKYRVELFDVSGRMVFAQEAIAIEGLNNLSIPTENLLSGNYMLEVKQVNAVPQRISLVIAR
jgi:hypothetical protein